MDKELKNRLNELEKNINGHTDTVGQNIINDFSNRFGHLKLDFK